MQDNAPCHKAMVVMNFLQVQNVTVMDGPPQSPNLNSIEKVWKTLGECSKARNPKTTGQLWNALQEEWNKCNTMWVARQADDSFVCFGAKPDKGFLDLKSRRIRKR